MVVYIVYYVRVHHTLVFITMQCTITLTFVPYCLMQVDIIKNPQLAISSCFDHVLKLGLKYQFMQVFPRRCIGYTYTSMI